MAKVQKSTDSSSLAEVVDRIRPILQPGGSR